VNVPEIDFASAARVLKISRSWPISWTVFLAFLLVKIKMR